MVVVCRFGGGLCFAGSPYLPFRAYCESKLGRDVFFSFPDVVFLCFSLRDIFFLRAQRLDVIGSWLPSLVDSFLPLILQLREDDNWRIRKAVLEVRALCLSSLHNTRPEAREAESWF